MRIFSSIFSFLRLLGALLILTFKRLASNPGLSGLALLQITLTVGLLTSAAFFAQAVDRVILQQELDKLSQQTGRPPFSTRVYFFPSSRKPMDVAAAEAAGRSIAGTLSAEIGLPVKRVGVQLESGNMMLLPLPDDPRYPENNSFLAAVNLVYIAGVSDHLEIVAGAPLDPDGASDPQAVDLWMHASLAAKMGVAPGERFRVAPTVNQPGRMVQIRGLWQAKDPTDPFWFRNPNLALRESFLVRRADYIAFVQPMIAGGSRAASWQISLDDASLNPAHAREYAEGFEQGMAVINKYVPGARLDVSPLDPLKNFVLRQTGLTVTLLGFNVPALGFLLYFLVLISAVIADSQRRETAIMVSRGASLGSILSLVTFEEGLLILIGAPLGIGLGMALALGMGYTDSFLTFTIRDPLPVSTQGMDFTLIGLALGISLLARLAPAWSAARRSIVEYETARARPLRAPLWRRAYLDFLLILPTVYAYQQMEQRGALALLVQERTEELFQDPLLIFVPALFILTASLLVMRLFSPLMNLLDWIASALPWTAPHLALRQLGRQSQRYLNPLLLVVVALSLGIYTRAMAASLDQWLVDRVYYQVGADAAFLPYREGAEDVLGADWIPPVSWFSDLPGVERATRVGVYPARMDAADQRKDRLSFMGVDRLDFPSVAWFRPDFAQESLGGLMNRLALDASNVLAPQAFLDEHLLRVGDTIGVWVALEEGARLHFNFKIAGTYTHFPTVQEDQPTLIGNLEPLFVQAGSQFPHRIWLRMGPDGDGAVLVRALRQIGMEPLQWQDASAIIAQEKGQMERVGIFGTLTVGFLAAALMAVLALLVQSYASLRERLYQFGVLRALGAQRRQLTVQLVIEYLLIVLYGTVAGAGIGGAATHLFAPFFRSASQNKAILPPLVPIVGREDIVRLALIFALVIVFAELLATLQALQRKLFEVMRMGQVG